MPERWLMKYSDAVFYANHYANDAGNDCVKKGFQTFSRQGK